ncbi:hypothetical protein LMG31506_00991 [Cupriavidus yeoncheonensis]|uniref:Lipoprotein n=1 Tax=Cupriavidus yeoncheonensis TaxID=1462994 RepID=A0A916IS30_9BURK|nr:Sbal_3080 family lipoprotein [Cupriavidus yeoncheonensis]CAG2132246.1 hypothetical protein LMG31506_00991 [Cupriavidus yeoncheonensis]
MNKALLAAALGLTITGCSTYQAVMPVDRPEQADPLGAFQVPAGSQAATGPRGSYGANGALLCVVANPVSGNEYLDAFRASLQARNFEVKLLPPYAPVVSCPLVATYSARSAWFWMTYLNSVDITVYQNGARAGKAVYSANRGAGGINLSNFVMPQKTLDTLVEQLFPGMLPPPPPPAGTPVAAPAANTAAAS